jgi:hypothetical protein
MEDDLNRLVGKHCWRLPHGRTCYVVEANNETRKLKIQDPSVWTGWITEKRFRKQWGIRQLPQEK